MNSGSNSAAAPWWSRGNIVSLLLLCCGAFILFVANNDFPVIFHADEPKKLAFLRQGIQDFKHPILMLQLGRLGIWLLDLETADAIMVAARTISAICGVVMVFMAWLIGRKLLLSRGAWLAALLTSVVPIIVVHAHYFKEDMVFTASAMACIYAYLRLADRPDRGNALFFGLMLGLVLSAQYKAVMLVALMALYPLLDRRMRPAGMYSALALGLVVAIPVIGIINYPAVLDPSLLLSGIAAETEHISFGHTLKIYPLPHWFSFHLTHSLLPGITPLVLAVAVAGMVIWASNVRGLHPGFGFMFVYVLAFYLAHEYTPMKPAPGYIRYMVPIVVPLMLFCGLVWDTLQQHLLEKRPAGVVTGLFALACLATAIYPAYVSVQLVRNLNDADTRMAALRWLDENAGDGPVYYGKYTLFPNKQSERIYRLDEDTIREMRDHGVRYAMASSFAFDKYAYGATLDNQLNRVYRYNKVFTNLFDRYSYIEFRPEFRSFAYSNPVIRIVDLESVDE